MFLMDYDGCMMIRLISSSHICMPVAVQSSPCSCDYFLCVYSVLHYCYCHLLDVTSSQLIVCIKRRIRHRRNIRVYMYSMCLVQLLYSISTWAAARPPLPFTRLSCGITWSIKCVSLSISFYLATTTIATVVKIKKTLIKKSSWTSVYIVRVYTVRLWSGAQRLSDIIAPLLACKQASRQAGSLLLFWYWSHQQQRSRNEKKRKLCKSLEGIHYHFWCTLEQSQPQQHSKYTRWW